MTLNEAAAIPPQIDINQPTHRADPFMFDNKSYCVRCGDDLEQTGRGNGYRHVSDWFNPGRRVAGVLPPKSR